METKARALFKYRLPQGEERAWSDAESIARAISAAFTACPAPGTLKIGLPSGHPAPLCGNPEFRRIASVLVTRAPGLVLFVLGGGSIVAREILLASLPNLQAAFDGSGEVAVTYPAGEAQEFLHSQFVAMLNSGIPKKSAIADLTLLSRQCGMDSDLWR